MLAEFRERVLRAIAELGQRRRGWLFVVTAVLCLAALALIPGIRVSTSRFGLVSEDNPYQARLLDFYEQFGYPDAPVFVISGGTAAERRHVVDDLVAELQALESLEDRVFARMDPAVLGEVLLLQRPDGLLQLRQALPEGVSPNEVGEGGFPAWFAAVENALYAGLEGEGPQPDSPEAAAEQLQRTMQGLTGVAAGLDRALEGGNPLAAMTMGDTFGDRRGIDEHGYLTTTDGDVHLVTLFPLIAGDEVEQLQPVVEAAREIRDRVLGSGPTGVNARLTGIPALAVDELRVIKRGLFQSSIAAAVGVYLLCLLFFRSWRQATMALVPLGVGVVCTLGVVRLIYGQLNLVTSSFVAVLLGLGIDFAVHVVARFNEHIGTGHMPTEAAPHATVRTGAGIMTGALATALTFLTTTTTEFTAYGELGVITAVGLLLIMTATFFLLPSLLSMARPSKVVATEPIGFSRVPGFIRRLGGLVLVVAVLGGIAGGFALPRIEFNSRYFDFLPASTESARALERLEFDPLMSPIFANLVADDVEDAREKARRLRELETVAGVQTATDLLPPLSTEALSALRAGFDGLEPPDFQQLRARKPDPARVAASVQGVIDALDEVRFGLEQAGRSAGAVEQAKQAFTQLHATLSSGGPEVAERLNWLEIQAVSILEQAWATAQAVAERGHYVPEDVPALFERRFVSEDGRHLAVYAIPAGDFWESGAATRFARDIEQIDPNASGVAMNLIEHERMIVEGFQRAAGYAAILILVVLMVDFRGPKDALLALVPTGLGWLWMLGIMAAIGLQFDVANIVSLPLVLGIGVTFGVHLLHRCREGEARNQGPADLSDVVRGTGGAVSTAAVTTMVGFAALMLGDYGAMQTLGLAMVIGIGTCLVASVVVLPALLRLLGRAR